MGNLTDDMTRLRGEVDALRGAREMLMSDLTRGARDLTAAVATMRADFTSAHAAMAKQAREERETFVAAVSGEVNSLLGEFSRDRNDMARKGRRDRRTFLSEMSRQVAGMCQETANDLMGARFVWRGKSPGKSRTVPEKKEREPAMPSKEEVMTDQAAMPEFQAQTPAASPEEPLKKEETKNVAAAAVPEPPAADPPKTKASRPVGAAMPFQKSKGKSWLDEKPAKTANKGKRGRK